MFETNILGYHLIFETNSDLFSPSAVDNGTLAMLSKVSFHKDDKLLDLGCGYGIVGILAANIIKPENIIMCDILSSAVSLSKVNAELNHIDSITILESDGFSNIIDNDFTLILSNPPYHADFSIAKRFIEDSYKRLLVGGRLMMVTKRLDWYKNKLTSVFSGVKIDEIDGYYVFTAIKKSGIRKTKTKEKNGMSKKLKRKFEKVV